MKRWLIRLLIAIPASLVLTFLFTAGLIFFYGQKSEPVKADAAIVLGAAVWGQKASPVFQARIDHGIELYRRGQVRRLLFTGAKGEAREPAESEVGRDSALAAGVPAADILIETQSHSTQDNLRYAWPVGKRQGLSTFLIVSDPLHMRRAMSMARDLGMTVYTSPTPTTRVRGWKVRTKFLARETYFYLRYELKGY